MARGRSTTSSAVRASERFGPSFRLPAWTASRQGAPRGEGARAPIEQRPGDLRDDERHADLERGERSNSFRPSYGPGLTSSKPAQTGQELATPVANAAPSPRPFKTCPARTRGRPRRPGRRARRRGGTRARCASPAPGQGHRNSDHARGLPIHESVLLRTAYGRRASSMPKMRLNAWLLILKHPGLGDSEPRRKTRCGTSQIVSQGCLSLTGRRSESQVSGMI